MTIFKCCIFCFFIFFIFNSCQKSLYANQESLDLPNLLCYSPYKKFDSLSGVFLLDQNTNPRYTIRRWQGIPSIGNDQNGVLYAAWYSGGTGEVLGNYITLAISIDSGKNWLNNKLIIAPLDSFRFFDPTFFNDKFGRLYLSFSRRASLSSNVDRGSLWSVAISYDKKSRNILFDNIQNIAMGVMMNKPIISGDSSCMYFPISRWFEGDSINHKPFIYKSFFGAECMEEFGIVGSIPIENKLRNFDEHMVVQLSDKSFLTLIRTIDGIYYSKSSDSKTWSSCKKISILGQTTSSRFHFSRLKSGRLLLVFNNSNTRTNLKAFLSEDDGKTWPYSLLIDNRSEVSYPDVVEASNGDLYLVYDFNRFSSGEINFLKFSESDIFDNKNLKKITIHKLK